MFSDIDKKCLDLFLKEKEDVIVTSTTKEFIEMCHNWYISLEKINLHQHVLVIALDVISYEKLKKLNINTVLLDKNLKNDTAAEWIENAKMVKGLGPIYIYENYNVNVIHLDTDIYFFKNFLPYLKQEIVGYDIIMCSDRRFDPYNHKRQPNRIVTVNHDRKTVSDWGLAEQAKYGSKNGAVFFLSRSSKTKNLQFLKLHFSRDILNQFPKGTQDGSLQTMTNSKLFLDKTDVRIKVLDVFKFPNGSLWQIPYLRNKIKDSCYLVHYNYHSHSDPIQRQKDKISAMQKYGHWYL